jgi:peroxiredoxin
VTELGELRRHYQEIIDRHVEVMAVSVDPPDAQEALKRKLELRIRFLSDEQGSLMDLLHIRDRDALPPTFVTGFRRENHDIFLPTTFLLDEQGIVRWVYRPESYRVRAPASEVLRQIDALG